jgi:hypothetical protein
MSGPGENVFRVGKSCRIEDRVNAEGRTGRLRERSADTISRKTFCIRRGRAEYHVSACRTGGTCDILTLDEVVQDTQA